MGKPRTEFPVIDRSFQLVKWSCERLATFPRAHRFALGELLQLRLCKLLERLVEARYSRDRAPILHAANLDLEVLRLHFRLAHELHCLSTDGFGFASRELFEIGKQVGGWLRSSTPAK